jgi:hypothetical protein
VLSGVYKSREKTLNGLPRISIVTFENREVCALPRTLAGVLQERNNILIVQFPRMIESVSTLRIAGVWIGSSLKQSLHTWQRPSSGGED